MRLRSLPHCQAPDIYRRLLAGEKVTFKDFRQRPPLELDVEEDCEGHVEATSSKAATATIPSSVPWADSEAEPDFEEDPDSLEESLGRLLVEMYPEDFVGEYQGSASRPPCAAPGSSSASQADVTLEVGST